MIDLKRLRDAPDRTKEELARRDTSLISSLDAILALDERRRARVQQVEALKAERNAASNEVARRKKAAS